jgi:4-amino-4-deoxy-L-arabinose transferase-like glycosyltransferase
LLSPPRSHLLLLSLALAMAWCVGIVGRGYWTPDEPREADIAWRMSWQADKAVPLLAGEAFCEKPPLTYWMAGAAIRMFGKASWAARLPNLLYALTTALSVGLLARRSAGPLAGWAAAAAIGTFLLPYQATIWLATDAPLLAAVSVALLGAYRGFYAGGRTDTERSAERLRGYTLMHAALAVGFLSKSAAAWMVPVLAFATLTVWEKRWRELLRWELYAGLALQAAAILTWVWFVYRGADGLEHLKVFFWNNLAGRFAHVDAPQELQYASAHRNSPGKYLLELPTYLWPWIFLVAAAARGAWPTRGSPPAETRPLRFAVACIVPTMALLSVAATARNVYLAPAMPGFALLVGWWVSESVREHEAWDVRAVRLTSVLVLLAALAFTIALAIAGLDSPGAAPSADRGGFWAACALGVGALGVGALGVVGAAALALMAESASRRGRLLRGLYCLMLAYCLLLTLPAAAVYRTVDTWQNLPAIGRAVNADSAGAALILMAPDETTRAFIDMYTRTQVDLIKGPVDDAAIARLRELTGARPDAFVIAQWPGRDTTPAVRRIAQVLGLTRALGIAPAPAPALPGREQPAWVAAADLKVVHLYALPNGRRYALLQRAG